MVLLQMSLDEAIGYVAFDELIKMINYCQFVTCHRFDSKRFCRDCRKNVIRNFKELKELKRMCREPHYSFSFGLMKPASNGGKNSLVTKLAGTFIYLAPKYTGLHCTLYSSMNQVDEAIKSSSCGGGYGDDEGSRSNMARIANFN
ncbi:hypothetical protein BC332_17259 [Capsicum chinense]|nr:hypothetical protein BC332_17259 [Capsicum chinense]